MTALQSLFSGDGFMPHGMCYLWRPELLWLHVISDTLVAVAYFAIPPTLVYLVLRARRELAADGEAPLGLRGLPYESMFLAFGLFIVACGTTHLIAVVTVWTPAYWVSGGAKAVTALASLATAVALPPLVPRALDLIRNARDAELNRRRLEEAHEELRVVHQQLQETDRLKSELFANVSHELRTPLTLILGPAERILQRDVLSDDDRSAMEVLRRNALQLLGHVDDLLAAASIESGTDDVRFGEADLAETLRGVAGHFAELARDRAIDLEVDAPPTLAAAVDRPKIERIVLNLLSNAFKFTPDEGRIVVRATPEEVEGSSWVEVRVEDAGPGVPEHLRDVIFERFRQGDGGATRRFGGTGLGLSIAREFARGHGGTLTVDTSDLGGAAFILRLPLRPTGGVPVSLDSGASVDASPTVATLGAKREGRTPAPREPAEREGTVLVVEDNDEMRRYLVDLLSSEYECVEAADGQAGLDEAVRTTPDLVVTDLMMPGKSGWQLIRELRGLPGLEDVPVLVLTARADPHLPATLLSEGAQDYLVKPVRADEFAARVANLITSSRARRVLRREVSSRETDLAVLSSEVARRKRELERAVDRKEVLLRELHHRVKGNLQTLASLLRIQMRSLDDPNAQAALREAEARVAAISLVHERLYAGDDPANVELGSYLRGLIDRVAEARGGLPEGSVLNTRLDLVVIDVDRAVPCGLIAFELISNALGHGMAAGGGRLDIALTADDDAVVLTVADDGPGIRDPGSGFGLELVELLARQLRGTLVRKEGEGTEWVLTVPLTAAEEVETR